MAREARAATGRGRNGASVLPYSDDLAYIEHEIRWVETRLLGLVAKRKAEHGASSWDDDDEDSLEAAPRRFRTLLARAHKLRDEIDARLAATRAAGVDLGLDRLCAVHRLDDFERVVLVLASAAVFSKRFDNLFTKLFQDGHGFGLAVESIFAFAELGFRERILKRAVFEIGSPLVRNELLTLDVRSHLSSPKDLLDASIEVSSSALAIILGNHELDAQFTEFSSVIEPYASFDQVVIAPADKHRILAVVEHHADYLDARARYGFDDVITYGRGAFMLFHGEPGTGKTLTAHAVAKSLGKRVLNVDIPTLAAGHQAERFLPGLFRAAREHNALLFFDECEAIFGSRAFGNDVMTVLLTELERFDGVAILATNLPAMLDEALERRILVRVAFPRPDIAAREAIWRALLPARAPLAPDVDVRALATRFDLSGGYIKNAILAALADAVHADSRRPSITMERLECAAGDQLRGTGSDNASVVQPTARLADVILPREVHERLREIVDATRHRAIVLDRWRIASHVSYGRGIAVLMHGPPGTGKTLSAEAIASELNRPLLVASVPSLQSKWVGDTEKRLEALFTEARAQRAVLFLDEADSLLTRRGEAGASRHDDSRVNVLLGLIERHNDLVLLATNRPEALDTALERRITYQVIFERPGAGARAAIWRGLLPTTVPTDDSLDFDQLGREFALSGGQIKNAVLKAAFRAASNGELTQADLQRAAAEELGGALGSGAGRSIGFGRQPASSQLS